MKRRTTDMRFWVVTVVLVLLVALSFAGTVMSRTDFDAAELEGYYKEKETQLVREVREFLNVSGFQNSGIALNRVVNADGTREYTLTIHHGEIDEMSAEARKTLGDELGKFDFSDERCSFFHEFLLDD